MTYYELSCFSTTKFSSSKTEACQTNLSRAEIFSARLVSVRRLKQALVKAMTDVYQTFVSTLLTL